MNGEVVSVEDPQWAPRSLLAIIDGVDAARWALILVEVGKEEDVNMFADWFVANPTKLDQVKRLWLKASWAIALGMRAGKTFKEMAAEVISDTAMFNEVMAYVEPAPKRNPANGNTNDDDQHRVALEAGAAAPTASTGAGPTTTTTEAIAAAVAATGIDGVTRAEDRDDRREDRRDDRRDDRRGDRDQDWRRGGGRGCRQQYQQWTHDEDRQGDRRQWDAWGQQSGATGGDKRKDDRR